MGLAKGRGKLKTCIEWSETIPTHKTKSSIEVKIADIIGSLPTGWVESEICRTQNRRKSMSVYQKRQLLNPYDVGLLRAREMGIARKRLTDEQITHIGRCSIDRKHIIVGKLDNNWVVVDLTRSNCREFHGHGYIVKGKKVIALHRHAQGTLEEQMDAFECAERSKPLDKMTADEIFSIGKGKRVKKHGHRGGIGFAELKKSVTCTTIETSRPWKRGERVRLRNENKRKRESDERTNRAIGVIRIAKVGMAWRSNPQATRANCGRMLY